MKYRHLVNGDTREAEPGTLHYPWIPEADDQPKEPAQAKPKGKARKVEDDDGEPDDA